MRLRVWVVVFAMLPSVALLSGCESSDYSNAAKAYLAALSEKHLLLQNVQRKDQLDSMKSQLEPVEERIRLAKEYLNSLSAPERVKKRYEEVIQNLEQAVEQQYKRASASGPAGFPGG